MPPVVPYRPGMAECEAAGCMAEATVEVPVLDNPSRIPHDHPDYKPPTVHGRFCPDHAVLMTVRSAQIERRLLEE